MIKKLKYLVKKNKILTPNNILEFFLLISIVYFSLDVYNVSEKSHKLIIDSIEMIRLSYELEQSSEDLSKFSLLYVLSGNIKYKNNYEEILRIRNGQKNKPKNLTSSYWFLSDEEKIAHDDTKKISMSDHVQLLPFSNEEKIFFETAHKTSDVLTILEIKAFELFGRGQQEEAIKIFLSPEYSHSKYIIMKNLDLFLSSVQQRTQIDLERIKNEKLYSLIRLFTVIYLFIALKVIFKID